MWIRIFKTMEEADGLFADGRPRLVIIGNERIALVKNKNRYLAVQDFCTHNKESLSKGIINYKGEIICPWHGYCFDLISGRESQQRSADLKTYSLKTDADGLFIEVES